MSGPDPLPSLPVETSSFLNYISENEGKPLRELLVPYLEYESKLRALFAQDPSNAALADNTVGLVPVYTGQEAHIKIQARNLEAESKEEKDRYVMELNEKERKKSGERAIVDFEEFKKNFTLFSEGALQNLDWTNIVAAGSSVLTPILPVPEEHKATKRALRDYYHEKLAPTSDVDLFIYGTKDEEVAIKRMEAVESTIRDNLLWETTSIRTKNTITIVSQYPNRHIQIVLRLYSSISEILTGFDVNCACVAYDGQQVYANPRAISSWMLQCNDIDLTRRSPSYEFRLSKYKRRGFEIKYPSLTREKIDPTIYERNINRLKGLAKLLVLERLPDADERETYLDDRRNERGRPARTNRRQLKTLKGDLKAQGAEVPEWESLGEDESNYHTVSIPYGKPHHAKRSEKLLFQKDMLLNAEWNKRAQKDRAGYLHRHPAFIGSVKDIIQDCCGYCPEAKTDEEKELQEKDDKIYVRGKISFLKDDPGRQEIGSFNPLTEDDWTEMAYIDEDDTLLRAIVDKDAETVKSWLAIDGHDVNRRDYTGRTPLHLAVMTSSAEIVKILIDAGAKIVWRIVDGRTVLHLAASRGDAEITKLILLKSRGNEELKDEREDKERAAKGLPPKSEDPSGDVAMEDAKKEDEEEDIEKESDVDEDEEMEDPDEDDLDFVEEDGSEGSISARTGASSFVEVGKSKKVEEPESGTLDETEEKDDILDINMADWDYQFSPLHYAIVNGHKEVVELLVSDFGADIMQPIKVSFDWQGVPRSALLSIPLIVNLPEKEQRETMLRTLLELGASSAQADMNGVSAFLRIIQLGDLDSLKILFEEDGASALAAARHIAVSGGWRSSASNSLITAIRQGDEDKALLLLEKGVPTEITFDEFMRVAKKDKYTSQTQQYSNFQEYLQQPAELAIEAEMPEVFVKCIENGYSPSAYCAGSHPPDELNEQNRYRYSPRNLTILDYIRQKIKSFQICLDEMKAPNKEKFPKDMVPEPTFDKDSYEYWLASKLVEKENESRKKHNESLEKTGPPDDDVKVKEKLEKVKGLEKRYKELAEWLVSKGGKTYKELQPEIWKKTSQKKKAGMDDDDDYETTESSEAEEEKKPEDKFEVKFTYSQANKDEKVNNAYHELFKAAWNGDEETLKKYTTAAWDEEKAPLLIASSNQLSYSLFSIAVYRKQPKSFLDLILSITTAQHTPAEESEKRYDPYYEGSEDDYYSDDSDDEMELRVEQVDLTEGKLTIDNIATLRKEVKSKVKAIDVINQSVPFIFEYKHLLKEHEEKEVFSNGPLLFQAVCVGNEELVSYIHNTIERLNGPTTKPSQVLVTPYADSSANIAVRYERIPLLEELMAKEGVGAMFKEKTEEKKDGDKEEEDEPVEKPKNYLGLSVHGKRRKDWAKAANPGADSSETKTQQQQLGLFAAYWGSFKVYEWLETGAAEKAWRQWQESLEKSKNPEQNYYLKIMRKADAATFKRWSGVDHPLLLHAVVMNRNNQWEKTKPESEKLAWYETTLKYFYDKNPSLLESKANAYGLTPILTAASVLNKYALQALINLGADLYAKSPENGLNLVHILFNGARNWEDGDFPRVWTSLNDCLNVLPEDFKQWAFAQRALGDDVAYTPMAYYLARPKGWSSVLQPSFIKLALQHSKGVELGVRSSLGDLPLHSAAKTSNPEVLQAVLDVASPEIVVTENANGMTALELADAKRYQRIVSHIPAIEYNSWSMWTFNNSATKMDVKKENPKEKAEDEEKQKELDELAEKMKTEIREEWGVGKDDANELKVWKILNKAVKGGTGKVEEEGEGTKTAPIAAGAGGTSRVLVTLREANETAERLAKRQAKDRKSRRRRYYYYQSNDENKDDIVGKWHP